MESICPSGASLPWGAPRETLSKETEELLIQSALQGRKDALADLLQPYLKPLNRFARMSLQSQTEAEDVVQQSVLRALIHLRQFRGEARFKTWLNAIALNEVLRARRGRGIQRVQPLHESAAATLADPSCSSFTRCEQKEKAERLHNALTRLPEKYRLIIQLRDLRELSIAETARSLSLTSAAVRTRHHRARKLLLRSLSTRVARRR
jgi:RNA polymerase sigma-70 factor (ECF subfamily)